MTRAVGTCPSSSLMCSPMGCGATRARRARAALDPLAHDERMGLALLWRARFWQQRMDRAARKVSQIGHGRIVAMHASVDLEDLPRNESRFIAGHEQRSIAD